MSKGWQVKLGRSINFDFHVVMISGSIEAYNQVKIFIE